MKAEKEILARLTALEEKLTQDSDCPLSFKEACAYLGYAPSYLYKLTYKNVIPHYKPTGKMIFFSKNEINEWIFKSRNQNSEISSQNENGSTALTTNDSNQIEMNLEEEVLIEFPLKSRRKK